MPLEFYSVNFGYEGRNTVDSVKWRMAEFVSLFFNPSI